MDLSDLEGSVVGPFSWHASPEAVADFITVSSDDAGRWVDHAPPGFAAAALFAVAPDLLDQLFDRSIIHGEQSFAWDRPIPVEESLRVTGVVSRVRERGGVHFITFDTSAELGTDRILGGRSLFLVSGESIPGGPPEFVRPNPPHSYRGEPAEGQVAASRADLIRYAAATRDWNPVHWDHDAGVAAGFPGVVVHGLLQAAWALRAVIADTESDRPVNDARFRFRNPLLPARPVTIDVERQGSHADVELSDDDTEYMSAAIELSDG
jgi:acyl dehydratase